MVVKHTKKLTYTWEETPDWLKDKYKTAVMQSGYLPGYMTYNECYHSLFYFHNQWATTWIFIIKMMLSAMCCAFICCVTLRDELDKSHCLPHIILFVACLSHTPISTFYHIFMNVSPDMQMYWNRADYAGIFVMIPLSSYSVSFYPFYCHPHLQVGQIVCVSIPACLNIILAVSPLYLKANKTRLLRTFFTGVVFSVALIPFFYDVANGLHVLYPSYVWGVLSIISCIAAGVSFISRFPERFYPYIFDNNINSHALMHFFIMTSHLCWYGFNISGYFNHKAIGFEC